MNMSAIIKSGTNLESFLNFFLKIKTTIKGNNRTAERMRNAVEAIRRVSMVFGMAVFGMLNYR